MKPHSIAYFISPHGFGHAARASAVMMAVHERNLPVRFEIFTTITPRFFKESLSGPFGCHTLLTDIGLVQKSAFEEDLSGTIRRLNDFLPFNQSLITSLSEKLNNLKCSLVICDIAAIGIAAANKAKIPSVLIENFTWDWIYEGYKKRNPQIKTHIEYLKHLFSKADVHIQAEPVCKPVFPDTTVSPVSRKKIRSRAETRKKLGIPEDSNAILISSGGVPEEYHFCDQLKQVKGMVFILAGVGRSFEKNGNLLYLPPYSGFYHPDIVHASDAVVGKAGYSTLAEVYHAGIPFGYISRPEFREADVLARFIQNRMAGVEIGEEAFRKGDWLENVSELLNKAGSVQQTQNGADQIAAFLYEKVFRQDL